LPVVGRALVGFHQRPQPDVRGGEVGDGHAHAVGLCLPVKRILFEIGQQRDVRIK